MLIELDASCQMLKSSVEDVMQTQTCYAEKGQDFTFNHPFNFHIQI